MFLTFDNLNPQSSYVTCYNIKKKIKRFLRIHGLFLMYARDLYIHQLIIKMVKKINK